MSSGVADSFDFEFQLAADYNMMCCLADFSVDAPAVNHPQFYFIKYLLALIMITKTCGWLTGHRHLRTDMVRAICSYKWI